MELWFIKKILSQPTAPFREMLVKTVVRQRLQAGNVPYFIDPVGNIVVGADSQAHYRRKLAETHSEPLRVFIAHLDHPGFHGLKWNQQGNLNVKWLGGSPVKHLNGARVWLSNSQGLVGKGTLLKPKLDKGQRSLASAEVKWMGPKSITCPASDLFGGFDFRAPIWNVGKTFYTKAADDLVGSAVIVELAIGLWQKNDPARAHFLGLLTRAEEVGFIGAIGHFDLDWLSRSRRSVVCLSLETSRTLPGAVVGKGPVVRLGDRATVFDPAVIEVLNQVAVQKLKKKFQRRIMDGGTCEATVAVTYGFPAAGISVPLGNYHNQSYEGGPDSRGKLGPAPEFVHLDDVRGMFSLCEGLMAANLNWAQPYKNRKAYFQKLKAEMQPLLG